MQKRFLITGGAGFIGSHLAKFLLNKSHEQVEQLVVVDSLDYAGNPDNLGDSVFYDNRFRFYQLDVKDSEAIFNLLEQYQIETVIHCAATSHVDKSIHAPTEVIQNNVFSGHGLIQACNQYYQALSTERKARFQVVNISTDEVYGDCSTNPAPKFEQDAYNPSSPYSASKAALEMIFNSYRITFKLPILTLHLCNNFGSNQFPEKLIPLTILNALRKEDINLYGDGKQRRQWIYVKDCVQIIFDLIQTWKAGDRHVYNISGELLSNKQVVDIILETIAKLVPGTNLAELQDLVRHVPDRIGHDRLYRTEDFALQTTGIRLPVHNFRINIQTTVAWYLRNQHELTSRVQSYSFEHGQVKLNS